MQQIGVAPAGICLVVVEWPTESQAGFFFFAAEPVIVISHGVGVVVVVVVDIAGQC